MIEKPMTLDKLPECLSDHLTHKVEPVVLKAINSLLASGKARVETGMVASSFNSNGTFDMKVKSNLIIELE